MTELKTLKDLDVAPLPCCRDDRQDKFYGDLREEVIKWIKMLDLKVEWINLRLNESMPGGYRMRSRKPKQPEPDYLISMEGATALQNWMINFFNITEEEIENEKERSN